MSASFYLPDSPSNPEARRALPAPCGLFGAQPPSVKGGWKQVSFSEQEEGVVEFADWQAITNASLWGKLRDFLIARFSLDEKSPAGMAAQQSARRGVPRHTVAGCSRCTIQ